MHSEYGNYFLWGTNDHFHLVLFSLGKQFWIFSSIWIFFIFCLNLLYLFLKSRPLFILMPLVLNYFWTLVKITEILYFLPIILNLQPLSNELSHHLTFKEGLSSSLSFSKWWCWLTRLLLLGFYFLFFGNHITMKNLHTWSSNSWVSLCFNYHITNIMKVT